MSRSRRTLMALALTPLALPSMRVLAIHGDVNCSDFKNRKQAQRFFKKHGGSPTNDPFGLDADHDGKACEDLPRR